MMRRGPKRKVFESDYLKARVWYWGVEDSSGLPTATAIERIVSRKSFRPRTSGSGGYIYPGYFLKIKHGDKCPGIKHVNKTDRYFPGTKCLFVHPFWDVIRKPGIYTYSIHKQVKKLQSEFAVALLSIPDDVRKTRRAAYLKRLFKGLHEESSLDTLTAIIVFSQLSRKSSSNTSEFTNFLSELIIEIFLRVAAQPPFYKVSDDLFEYINKNFLEFTNKHEWYEIIQLGEVGGFIEYNRMTLNLIDTLGILKTHNYAPSSCLGIVYRHLSAELLEELFEIDVMANAEKISGLREIKALTKELDGWGRSKISQKV